MSAARSAQCSCSGASRSRSAMYAGRTAGWRAKAARPSPDGRQLVRVLGVACSNSNAPPDPQGGGDVGV
eukprot:3917513-Prymnesium_polylepis.1